MGNASERFCQALSPSKKQHKIFIGGLNAVGKTTMLYKLKLNQIVGAIPTIGFNVQTIYFNHMRLDMWDVGGGFMIRRLFRHYFENLQGLIYIIRFLSDKQIDQAMNDLWEHHLQFIDVKVPILVFINSSAQENINLQKIKQKIIKTAPGRNVHIQQCYVLTSKGVNQGLTWLTNEISPVQ